MNAECFQLSQVHALFYHFYIKINDFKIVTLNIFNKYCLL